MCFWFCKYYTYLVFYTSVQHLTGPNEGADDIDADVMVMAICCCRPCTSFSTFFVTSTCNLTMCVITIIYIIHKLPKSTEPFCVDQTTQDGGPRAAWRHALLRCAPAHLTSHFRMVALTRPPAGTRTQNGCSAPAATPTRSRSRPKRFPVPILLCLFHPFKRSERQVST